jgi:hypothetical protein
MKKINILTLDGSGRPLKSFEVGKWYTNPKFNLKEVPDAKYFRVCSVEVCDNHSGEYIFNSIFFDAVANENWKITEIHLAQANCDYDQEMQLVEKVEPEFIFGI